MRRSVVIGLLACATLALVAADSSSQAHRISLEPRTAATRTVSKRADAPNKEDLQDNSIPDEQPKQQNESETPITIGEPYKSIIQTTTRFALAQSRIAKHINLDTAMNLLNEAAYHLAKPTVLLKTIKLALVSFAMMTATLFLFPGAHKFADTAWRDPVSAFNFDRYLTNGLSERSVIEALSSRTDETLSRVGLQDNSCRQRSLCYLGEILKCSFPHTADTITKFVSDNFAESSVKDNIYARAFTSGFVNQNCTAIGSSSPQEAHNCLSSFFQSILSGNESRARGQVRK